MQVPFVDLKAQYATLRPDMDAAIQSVLDRTAFVLGPEVAAFERAFAAYVGVKHAVGVSSGTSALRLALQGLGIGPGDEVLTVADTYIATCEAITHAGAAVRLVDAHPRTYNMDPARLAEALPQARASAEAAGRRLRAIMPVHLYGQPADMDPIMAVAREHNLLVIEDCAQSHGARYHDRLTGTFGDAACFSFYPGKNLGAYGDGGAVVTNSDAVAERIHLLNNHGQKVKYEHLVVGYCDRLDNLQAAVLGVKLPHLDGWNARRRSRAELYRELLADVPGVTTPHVPEGIEPVYHLYALRVSGGRRDALQRYLNEAGVGTGLHYPIPVHLQQAYGGELGRQGDFPASEALAGEELSLPMFAEMTDEQVAYVAGKIKEFMGRER